MGVGSRAQQLYDYPRRTCLFYHEMNTTKVPIDAALGEIARVDPDRVLGDEGLSPPSRISRRSFVHFVARAEVGGKPEFSITKPFRKPTSSTQKSVLRPHRAG